METSIVSLFDQLGLDSTEEGIDNFIEQHSPLSGNVELHKAKFWNTCQSSFLAVSYTHLTLPTIYSV